MALYLHSHCERALRIRHRASERACGATESRHTLRDGNELCGGFERNRGFGRARQREETNPLCGFGVASLKAAAEGWLRRSTKQGPRTGPRYRIVWWQDGRKSVAGGQSLVYVELEFWKGP